MIKNKNLKMISNRLDELITSDFISFNKDNMFKDMELCIDVPKMYYEINTGSLDGFYINNMLSDDNYLPKYESLLHVDKFILENKLPLIILKLHYTLHYIYKFVFFE